MLKIMTFVLGSMCFVGVGNADELKQEFFAKAPEGWKQLANDENQITGKLHYRVMISDNNTPRATPQIDKINLFKVRDFFVALTTLSSGIEAENVVVAGPSYGFKVSRKNKSEPYKLQSLVYGTPEVNGQKIRGGSFLWSNLRVSRVCWNAPLDEMIVDPGFVLKGLRADGKGLDRLVRMDFDYISDGYKLNIRNGSMTFKPAENWAVQKASFNLRPDWNVSFINEYRRSRDGKIRLSRSDYEYNFSTDKIKEHHEAIFEQLEGEVIPENEFTLSAFKLPEPVAPKQSQNEYRTHYWLIAGAVLLFGLAFFIRRSSR